MVRFGCQRNVAVSGKSAVELLIKHNGTIDFQTAAALGSVSQLCAMLSENPNLATAANSHGSTALHFAASAGQVEAAQTLLECGAGINAPDTTGCPPIWYAAYSAQNSTMTRFLHQHGADVTFRNIWNKGLLSYDIGDTNAAIIREAK